MNWQFTPVLILYMVAFCVSLGVALLAWRLRPARGVEIFTLMVTLTAVWALGDIVEIGGSTLLWKLVGLRVGYLGVMGTIFFWNIYVIAYTQNEQWLSPPIVALLAIIPIVSWAMVFIAPRYDFFYRSYELTLNNGLLVIERTYGPAFWIWAAYGYVSVVAGSLLLIQTVIRVPNLYRGQAGLLILAALVPLASNGFYLAGYNPLAPYDPSSLAFTLAGVFIILSLRRFHFIQSVPVAHHLVFKTVNIGVVIIDLHDRITEMNPVAEKILGRALNDVVGKVFCEAVPDYNEVLLEYRTVMRIKTEIMLADRCYELQIAPLLDHSQTKTGRVIMLYDVTDQRRLIDDLNAYAHTVAHDLKNPLSLIAGFASLVEQLEGEEISETARAYVSTIATTSYKMAAIINELLLFASVRSQDSIETRPLDMADIVDNVKIRLQRMIDETRASIVIPDQWPAALGYAPWVEEIWANYISNALKYGGHPPHITLGAEKQDDGAVRFWVRDNGRGMTPAERDRLFTRFYRLDQHAGIEGHGLGLSIVLRIAEKLGGRVGVESKLREGSAFYFTLPLAESASLSPAAPKAVDLRVLPGGADQGSVSRSA